MIAFGLTIPKMAIKISLKIFLGKIFFKNIFENIVFKKYFQCPSVIPYVHVLDWNLVYYDWSRRMGNLHNFKNLYLWQSKGVLKVVSTWGHYTTKIFTEVFTEGQSFFKKPTVIEGSALMWRKLLVKCLFVFKMFYR